MSETIEIKGMSEVLTSLKKLDDEVQNKTIKQGLKIGGKVILVAAQSEAPTLSGLTRRSIKMTSSSRKGVSRVSVGLSSKDYTGDTFYAAFLLYGHKAGSRKLGGARKDVPANNFLKRAVEKSGEAAAEETIEAWAGLIQLAAKP